MNAFVTQFCHLFVHFYHERCGFKAKVINFVPFKKHSSVISSSFAPSISSNVGKNKLLTKTLSNLVCIEMVNHVSPLCIQTGR